MLRFLRQQRGAGCSCSGVGEFLLLAFAFWLAAHHPLLTPTDALDASRPGILLRSRGAFRRVRSCSAWPRSAFTRRTCAISWFGMLDAADGRLRRSAAIGLVILYYVVPQAASAAACSASRSLLGFVLVASFRVGVHAHGRCRGDQATRARARRRLARGADPAAHAPPRGPPRLHDRRLRGAGRDARRRCRPNRSSRSTSRSTTGPNATRSTRSSSARTSAAAACRWKSCCDCKQPGIDITELATFFERESGKVKLSSRRAVVAGVLARLRHVAAAARVQARFRSASPHRCVLLLTWPLMLLVALAIRIESGKGQPILYRQERVGERGRVFKLIKFRSMRTDAEKDGVARWASKSDDRVTRVGRVIRRTRLDELPQLWNVLRGDMSVIGPRPGAAAVRRRARREDPLLQPAPLREAGSRRLGAAALSVRRVRRGCRREAQVRPLLRQEPQSAVRPHDPDPDVRSRAVRPRRALKPRSLAGICTVPVAGPESFANAQPWLAVAGNPSGTAS